MVGPRIYVEGGGNAKALRSTCRRGFGELFRKAGLEGKMPRVIASGSRQAAYEDFCTALRKGPDPSVLLLVDSEAPVASSDGPWDHLLRRADDQWTRPARASDEQCHLMVQCMESWFLADRPVLVAFFGRGFNESALPRRREIEDIPKADVFEGLRRATRATRTKGRYGKGAHSFEILALIDPHRVRIVSPYADRLLEKLDRL